jgi:PAS domain S-box-containing protein
MTKLIPKLKEANHQLLLTIADQQETEDRLNLQLTRLKLMYEFVSALNAAQTVTEIYQIALNGICPALRTARAAVVTIGSSPHRLEFQATVGLSENYKQAIEAFFADSVDLTKLKPRAFPTSATFFSDGISAFGDRIGFSDRTSNHTNEHILQSIGHAESIGALAIFPLEYERRHLGDIVAYFDEPRQFTDEEVQLTKMIVTNIAIALTRKQAEQALKESQEFIQRIADTTPNILYIYDIEEYRNIYCNQGITTILGYTDSEIKGMGSLLLDVVVHPDDLTRIKEHYQQVRGSKSEDLFVIEYRMRDIHGKWKWFYSQETVFFRNVDQTVKQVIGAASDISQLKETEIRLHSSLSEKEMLLREVHHRVKNNLGLVDSLLSMQARYINDVEALKSVSDSQKRIHAMSLIHEQLYQSQDMGKIDFCEYLQRLVDNLHSSTSFNDDQITLKLDTNSTFLKIDTAISMGLIVNELLTNAFKHAFPDRPDYPDYPNYNKGLIEVILYESTQDHKLHLIIRDNGIGIPEGFTQNFAQNPTFNMTNSPSTSFGLRLVSILTQQLRATLDLSCSVGTSFHFTLETDS